MFAPNARAESKTNSFTRCEQMRDARRWKTKPYKSNKIAAAAATFESTYGSIYVPISLSARGARSALVISYAITVRACAIDRDTHSPATPHQAAKVVRILGR